MKSGSPVCAPNAAADRVRATDILRVAIDTPRSDAAVTAT
jgi:hypothetical protein